LHMVQRTRKSSLKNVILRGLVSSRHHLFPFAEYPGARSCFFELSRWVMLLLAAAPSEGGNSALTGHKDPDSRAACPLASSMSPIGPYKGARDRQAACGNSAVRINMKFEMSIGTQHLGWGHVKVDLAQFYQRCCYGGCPCGCRHSPMVVAGAVVSRWDG